jgi:peroxiredoxin Q/BCP
MNLLMVGSPAIDFTLPDQDGNLVKISDLIGSKIVLYFYPKDDTPGCTIEAKDFATADS